MVIYPMASRQTLVLRPHLGNILSAVAQCSDPPLYHGLIATAVTLTQHMVGMSYPALSSMTIIERLLKSMKRVLVNHQKEEKHTSYLCLMFTLARRPTH